MHSEEVIYNGKGLEYMHTKSDVYGWILVYYV